MPRIHSVGQLHVRNAHMEKLRIPIPVSQLRSSWGRFWTPWNHLATPTSPEVPPHLSGILLLPAPAPGRRQAPEFCRERGIWD